jgi:hypothetical protein
MHLALQYAACLWNSANLINGSVVPFAHYIDAAACHAAQDLYFL